MRCFQRHDPAFVFGQGGDPATVRYAGCRQRSEQNCCDMSRVEQGFEAFEHNLLRIREDDVRNVSQKQAQSHEPYPRRRDGDRGNLHAELQRALHLPSALRAW